MNEMGEIAAQVGLVLFVLVLAYFLLVRPQLKRMSGHQAFLAALSVGDRVVTRGGLIGNIAGFEDAAIINLALSDAITVSVDINGIDRKIAPKGGG